MSEPKVQINTVSVKVMRSYDYCHFEINLSASLQDGQGIEVIDELRKDAARLADKAVKQYKLHKRMSEVFERCDADYEEALRTPEPQRTPAHKAIIKHMDNESFRNRRYDYQDDYKEPFTDAEDVF